MASGASKKAKPKPEKLSRTRRPDGIAAKEWQRLLRRQFGRELRLDFENIGGNPVFSEYRVSNPESKSSYRVSIRGLSPGQNYCSCPDYTTNELGTCKHVEFMLAKLEKLRGAKKALKAGYRPPYSELYLKHDGRRRIYFKAGTECPPQIAAAAAELFDAGQGGMLPFERLGDIDGFLERAAEASHRVRTYDDALDVIAARRDAMRRAETVAQAFPAGPGDPALARLLKVPLWPYQAEGALFAVKAGRALIGDDMGLGKTIQAIAAAEIFARHFGAAKVLVVCPASLKYQWQSEIARFTGRSGEGQTRVIGGGRALREKAYAADDFCKITNYERLKPDLEMIAAWAPDLVIVDEAQRVKNWNTVAARALKRIDSPYAIVLTGTPLENKIEELISIVQFVDQHRLGPTWKLLNEHQVKNEAGQVTGYTKLAQLGETLAPVMIRRRKAQVLTQLPARRDQIIYVPMTEPQLVYHEENREIAAKIVTRWRRTGFLSDMDQRRLTAALQNMRMSCNSTFLLDQTTDHGVKADEAAALLQDLFADPAAKAVVFSQWRRTHHILVKRFKAMGICHVCFHGGVASENRPALIETFRDDQDCRVFLSTDAGAAGLNLQHASTLINMDLPWNPALLEQRIGRIHRMGQSRPVHIVNYVSKGTIEEGMLSTLAFKKGLAEGILDGGANEISLGGSRLTRFMESVEEVTGGIGAAASTEAEAPATVAEDEEMATAAAGPPPAGAKAEAPSAPAAGTPDPWAALIQAGSQFVSALAMASDPQAASHPWIERDAKSGARHFKIPVPPPETARALAEMLSALAENLRAR